MSGPITIHVVEPDPAVRDSLELLLPHLGFAVSGYRSCEDFLARADVGEAVRRGCLLAELEFAGMSGLELLHQLTAREVFIPIVIMPRAVDGAALHEVRRLAVPVLEKPFHPAELRQAIAAALAQRTCASGGAVSDPIAPPQVAPPSWRS